MNQNLRVVVPKHLTTIEKVLESGNKPGTLSKACATSNIRNNQYSATIPFRLALDVDQLYNML